MEQANSSKEELLSIRGRFESGDVVEHLSRKMARSRAKRARDRRCVAQRRAFLSAREMTAETTTEKWFNDRRQEELKATTITNSTVCTMGQGDQVCDQVCGVCECDDPYSGPECQCEQLGNCRSDDYCNGFECDACGFCVCNETTYGERCECDILQNFCPGRGINELAGLEEVCSGHGTCVCESNKCECETAPLSGFKYFGLGISSSDGLNGGCECNPDGCYNPTFPVGLCYNQVEESYNNQCTCGGCNCPPPFFAVDNTCIDLDTLCDQLDDCVLCFLNNPCPNEPCSVPNDCSSYCVNKTFEQLEVDQIIPDRYSFDICSLEYEGCTVEFFFSTNEVDPVLISNSEDYLCFTTIIPWIVAGSAVGAILLVGLIALIILKVCLMVLDRVEYKRFIKEMEGADFAPVMLLMLQLL